IMAEMLPATLQLTLISLVIAWLIAFLMAAVAARSNRIGQAMGTVIEVVAAAVPHFWLGAMLIIIFSTWLGWLPSVDTGTVQGIILPALTLAIPLSGFLAQLMRDSLVTAMSSPFALAARARGASEGQVFFRHGFRHAALPALNLTGWAVATSISGAVVVEEVFARPGLGRSLLGAVLSRDMPMVTGIALFSALIYMVVMLIVEAVEAIINPAAARGDAAAAAPPNSSPHSSSVLSLPPPCFPRCWRPQTLWRSTLPKLSRRRRSCTPLSRMNPAAMSTLA